MAQAPTVIELRDVEKRFLTAQGGYLVALEHATFSVQQNEFVCILGPSGCGKSTILNVLCGLERATGGQVTIASQAARGDGPLLAYVFQDARLLPWRTVQQNLEFVLQARRLDSAVVQQRIAEAIELVGLGGFEGAYPHQLSGGMQQRVAIARALCVDPLVLLMDEPFSALDEITARSLRKQLLEIWERRKKTVLFVTHNCFEATFLADRIILMTQRPGRVYREVTVDLPRPRDYDDPEVFAFSSRVVKDFLRQIGLEKE
jgi:NitT/TauT family transport system ATP-binding protein